MTKRRITGWGLLSLLPIGYFSFAILADELAEALVGLGVGLGVIGLLYVGMNLAMGDK